MQHLCRIFVLLILFGNKKDALTKDALTKDAYAKGAQSLLFQKLKDAVNTEMRKNIGKFNFGLQYAGKRRIQTFYWIQLGRR